MVVSYKGSELSRSGINKILFIILLSAAVFTPADTFKIKLLSFGMLLCLNLDVIFKWILTQKNVYLLFFGVGFPLLLLLLSYFRCGDLISSVKGVYVCAYLLMIPIIQTYKIDYFMILRSVLFVLATIINVGVVMDFIGIVPLAANPIFSFFHMAKEAMIGKSPAYAFYYMVFFKTSPLLLIPFTYYFNEKKWIMLFNTSLALLFSGTRGNVFAAILVGFCMLFIENRKYIKKIIYIGVCFLTVLLVSDKAIPFLINMFTKKAAGDDIKSSDLAIVLHEFRIGVDNLLFGQGFGTMFYSESRTKLLAAGELSYWFLIRQIGLIAFIVFLFFLIRPIIRLWKDENMRYIVLAYVFYLIIAYTNPLLFTTTAYIMYVYVNLHMFDLDMLPKVNVNSVSDG